MQNRTYRSMLLKVLLVGSFGLITISYAYGLERIRWKVQHTGLPGQLKGIERFAQNIKIMSEGKINFRLYKPGSLVPNSEIWNAIGNEQLDAGMSSPLYILDKHPELSFFAAVPFAPSITEFTVWMNHGGGQELKEEIYAKKGLKALNCGLAASESGGWFKKRYDSVEEFKGLNMRILGLGSKVMEKLGVKTQVVSFKDIHSAFKKGQIDAAEFGYPHIDHLIGMHKSAKYYYFPGWQQQFTVVEFVTQKKKWDGLSKAAQAIIETSCNAHYLLGHINSNSIQPDAMRKIQKEGVKFVTWKDSEIKKIEEAWNEVAEEMSAEDPLFAKVYTKYKAFREKYAIWGDRAFLK